MHQDAAPSHPDVAWKIHITILVNKPAVLLSLAKPHLQGGQALITLVTEEIIQLSEMGARVNLQPPTEVDNEHTARRHSLAREATVESSEVNPPPRAQTLPRMLGGKAESVDGTSEPTENMETRYQDRQSSHRVRYGDATVAC